MPLIRNVQLPSGPQLLDLPEGADQPYFIFFMGSIDPATGESWCPDVRASLPDLERKFGAQDAPSVTVVEVGLKPEWRDADNIYRKHWNIKGVPTLARFEKINGQVTETARLDEDGIMDQKTLDAFVV